ncbi:MAG: hypothetical protein V3U27_22185, partial [Candidatus Tectomicrobia bacterium]
MVRQHLSRKTLKRPDQFLTQSAQMIQWAKNHLKHILYGVLGLVVVLGLVLGWSGWQKQRRQKAALLLHQALVLLKTDGAPSATPVDK